MDMTKIKLFFCLIFLRAIPIAIVYVLISYGIAEIFKYGYIHLYVMYGLLLANTAALGGCLGRYVSKPYEKYNSR